MSKESSKRNLIDHRWSITAPKSLFC